MSNTKFTPGPWALEKRKSGCKNLIGDGKMLCAEFTRYLTDSPNYIDADANAALIAAAPELYEALDFAQRALDDADLCVNEETGEEYDDVKKMRAALKKARGES